MKGKTKTYKDLTTIINDKYETHFQMTQIKYQVDKLLQATFGIADQDSYEFVNLTQKEAKDGGYFTYE